MKRFGLIAVVATVIILAGGVYLFSRTSKPETVPPVSGYEYYWGETCPHCANVEEFLQSWEDKDKVQIDKREVYLNKANASLLAERAKSCGISPSSLGVPFLVTPEGACITGDTPIIGHFQNLTL